MATYEYAAYILESERTDDRREVGRRPLAAGNRMSTAGSRLLADGRRLLSAGRS